jgi:phage tail sheath protein FI
VATNMIAKATALRAIAVIDAPSFTETSDSVSDVVAERLPGGTYGGFQSRSPQAVLCWPWLNAYNPDADTTAPVPLSAFFAGVQSAVDNGLAGSGFWQSSTNQRILGALAPEVSLWEATANPNSDLNQLVGSGIVTVRATGGLKIWGQRSAAFFSTDPAATGISTFYSVRRTIDFVRDAVEASALAFLGRPINTGLIQSIIAAGNAFIGRLVEQGAIVQGKVFYNPADNPPESVAEGILAFGVETTPSPGADKIQFTISLNLAPLGDLV